MVDSISSQLQNIQGLQNLSDSSKLQETVKERIAEIGISFGDQQLNISSLGQLGLGKNLSTEEKQEFQLFMQDLRSGLKQCNLDASALAESAPNALKAKAEQMGVDLESAITRIADGVEALMGSHTPKLQMSAFSPTAAQPEESLADILAEDEESDESAEEQRA